MCTYDEIDLIAEAAWAAKRSGADVNLDRIAQLEAYGSGSGAGDGAIAGDVAGDVASDVAGDVAGRQAYMAIAGIFKALSTFYKNRYDEAYALGTQTFTAVQDHCSPLWIARMHYVMGLLAASKNKLPEALSYWKDGLVLAESLGDQEIIGYFLYNIADINRAIFKRYDLAKIYYKKGLQLCGGSEKHIFCGLMLVGLSRCEYLDGNIELALTHCERALELSLSSKDDRAIGICYEFAGSRHSDLGNYDKGLAYLLKSLENREARQDLYGLVNSHCALSICYHKMGDFEKALSHIKLSESIYIPLNTHVLDDLVYKQLALVYESCREWELATGYYKKYSDARNALISKELEDVMAVMAAELHVEMAKRDAEIYRLKTVALQEKNDEISELAAELEEALEDLKETQGELVRTSRLSGLLSLIAGVAHEINTPLGNSITLASFLENMFENMVDVRGLGDVRDVNDVHELEVALHHLIHNLKKVADIVESLKKFNVAPERLVYRTDGLVTFVEEWVSEMQVKEPRLKVALAFEGEINCRFEPISLARVLNEVIMNSLRHAYPPDEGCDVELVVKRIENGGVCISIKDYGVGMALPEDHGLFEPFQTLKQATSGLGLGLHLVYLLTVNVLRGEVKINAEPEKFTEILIKLI